MKNEKTLEKNENNSKMDELFVKRVWPKAGAKLKYKGTHHFWFTNIINNAHSLKLNEVYTLKSIDVFSSWVRIRLEEFPELDFALSFFEEVV